MNYDQIVTFLTVAAYKNISSAANYMYLSQSTVSNRIQTLEEELDAQLFVRRKGLRSVELTSYGNAFIPIAEQWASLYKDMQALKYQDNISTLTIAAIDAVNTYTFTGLYDSVIRNHPLLKLNIRTHHSNEIHGLVENRTADIGFTFSRINYPNIISKPVFRELMYLVCRKDTQYHDQISCMELSTDHEIYLNWGPDYYQWHTQHWPEEKYPRVTVNTGNLLLHFLHEEKCWAIAPMSVIQAIKGKDITYYTIKEAPPSRICYELTSRYPNFSHVQAIELFETELQKYIQNSSSVCAFEDWMLDNN